MRTAIILAGGRGQRLLPLTSNKPKCMVPVAGMPIIERQLRKLQSHGFDRVLVSSGYRFDVIESYLTDGQRFGLKIEYVVEAHPLGRGGGLRWAMQHLWSSDEWILGLNGDVLTDANLDSLIDQHLSADRVRATVLTVPLKSPYGIVECSDDSMALGFKEKPELPYWINGGVYIFNRDVEQLLPVCGDLEETTLPYLASLNALAVYQSRDFWSSIDSIKDLDEASLRYDSPPGLAKPNSSSSVNISTQADDPRSVTESGVMREHVTEKRGGLVSSSCNSVGKESLSSLGVV